MKTLILLLLPLFAIGQASQATVDNKLLEYDLTKNDKPVRVKGDVVVNMKDGILTIDTTAPFNDSCIRLSDLQAYALECYNDSTAVVCVSLDGIDWRVCPDRFKHYFNSREFMHKVCYTHRQPTFEGFINWLKARL